MKNKIITILLILLFISGFSQNPLLDGRRIPSVKKEKLKKARFMSDLIPDYPTQWNEVIDYVSVEILASCDGKVLLSKSTSDTLSSEQKNILNTADMSTDIGIKIKFRYKDPENDNLGSSRKIKEMEYVVTVVPEIEAEYPGGYKQMAEYFNENVINKIPQASKEKIPYPIVKFTINEEGRVVDAKISRTSTNPETDKLFLEVINKMPKWKPAENSDGIKIKQEFSIPFGRGC